MKKDTVCRLCSSCCPIEVEIENQRLIAAKRKSFLPEEKRLICPKLKAAADIVYSPARLQKPLVRQKDGRFQETSWDDALNLVADRFRYFKNTHGAPSVAWLRGMAADWGAPWDYANRLMNAFGSPNTIGNGSVCHVAREIAHVYTYGAMTLPEAKNARCIVVWGKNDMDTSPGACEGILHARRNGAKLIVIDPVKTGLAEIADIWLQVKPGHDGLLAMAMIHEIISQNLYDADFVSRWTTGFEHLKAVAENYAAETVAEKIWLEAGEIREAAQLYASTQPACIIDGNGLDMQLNVFDATRAVCMLRGLTGNIDKSGGDFIPQPVPVRNLQLKKRLPEDVEPITRNYPLFNTFHETWGIHAQSCLMDAILEEKPYPVKMLVVQSGNPLVSMTDARRVRRALEKLEFMVVIDPFMTRTAEMADIVLPATTCFEKTQLNRAFIRNNPVVLQNRVIEPLGESRPDWQITFELAGKLGLEKEFPWQTAEEAIDYQLEPTGITVEKLRNHPAGIRTENQEYEKYKIQGFETPSGTLEFYSRQLAENGFAAVPFAEGHGNSAVSFYDQKDRYPFLGISGARTNRFTHSQFRNIPALLKNARDCVADIHISDAREKKIADGDTIKIETPRGHVRMRAKISDAVRQGCVRIAWGWGNYNPACNLNELTDDSERNALTGTPSTRSFMCSISKVS